MSSSSKPTGPDLTRGVSVRELPDRQPVEGHVGDDAVIVVRNGDDVFAIGAHCTHYKGPLAKGLVVGQTVRCPWHHACFSLTTGDMVRPPALDPVTRWRVERDGDHVVVKTKLAEATRPAHSHHHHHEGPASVVIVGGGAAGLAAVRTLRHERYSGAITMISADGDAPYDRPNLSKDFLAGTAQEDWMALWESARYKDESVDLILERKVVAIDPASRSVRLEDGRTLQYGALLLATGAQPVKLDVPGAQLPHVHYLRTFSDCRSIIGALIGNPRVAVIGASFIGLEVAASLRARDLEVHVIAPAAKPLENVFGPEVAEFVRRLHEKHGVNFHLGESLQSIQPGSVTLATGASVPADLVVAGIGVRPDVSFAQQAGLAVDRGITVNELLETSVPGIFAAGDIARWPDPHTGERIRVEHWVLAERMGQAAARNILGRMEPFDAVPFFWSQHYDVAINYVGHAEKWDAIHLDGDLKADEPECRVEYSRNGRTLAVATISRDLECLQKEVDLEHLLAAPTA